LPSFIYNIFREKG